MIIAKHFEFEAAHKLPNKECYGSCRNLHGHTYKLIIEVSGILQAEGWVINFKDLKEIVKRKIVDVFDHAYINDIIPLPTAENMVLWIVGELQSEFKNMDCKLHSVVLYETSGSYAKINC